MKKFDVKNKFIISKIDVVFQKKTKSIENK